MTTLYDYYNSIGQSLPSVASRQGVASSAGISGYQGTAAQNGTLLAYLQKNGGSTGTPTATPPPTTVPVASTAPTTAPVNNGLNTGQNGSTPPVSGTGTTNPAGTNPTQPTIGTAYKSVNTPDLPDYDTVGNTLKGLGTTPVDESAIRSSTIGMFQQQLDALQQVYAQKMAEVQRQGSERMGEGRATQSRSGLLGSDFADTQNANITGYNKQLEDAETADYNNKIGDVLGRANTVAQSEIDARKTALATNAKAYIDFLGGADQRKITNLTNLGKLLISQGITDISKISPSDLQTLATKYQSTPDQIAQYLKQAQIDQATAYKNSLITTSAYGSVIDPATGKALVNGIDNKNIANASSSFYALQKQYPDAGIQYDPAMTPEENLAAAQQSVSGNSGYFDSKMTNNKTYTDAFGNVHMYNSKAGGNNSGGGSSSGGTGSGGVPSSSGGGDPTINTPRANAAAVKNASTKLGAITAAHQKLQGDLAAIASIADKVNAQGIPDLDAFINDQTNKYSNNPLLVQFKHLVTSARGDYAVINSGGSNSPDQGDQARAAGAIPSNGNSAVYNGLITTVNQEAQRQITAQNSVINQFAHNSAGGVTPPTSTSVNLKDPKTGEVRSFNLSPDDLKTALSQGYIQQ
jgi:hypothetical protein